MLKIGNYVKVKPHVVAELKEVQESWVGKIASIDLDDNLCDVELDAITLDSLEDEFLKICAEEGLDHLVYVFGLDDVELTSRRDTDEQFKKALDDVNLRMDEFSDQEDDDEYNEDANFALRGKWSEEFNQSSFFQQLNPVAQENADFAISCFMDYAYNYEGQSPQQWDDYTIKSVCLDWIPRKVSADEDFFGNCGDILHRFFQFLQDKKYLPDTKALQETILEIKDQILVESNRSENWGMAKSMMMMAKGSGYDPTDQESLNKFMMDFNSRTLSDLPSPRIPAVPPPDPFKGIGRNQKITVKYSDGRIISDVKFKKVQEDLKNGKCEIMK